MIKINDDEKLCLKCSKVKKKNTGFYNSYNSWHSDGKMPYCKQCLKKSFDENNVATIKEILRQVDKPFQYELWEKAKEDDRETLGAYFILINLNNKYDTYADSIFEPGDKQGSLGNKDGSSTSYIDLDRLESKWGSGYSYEEYQYFEKKYDTLKHHYPEKTSMHTEALLTYIRYRVKEELSTAKGEVKDAKEWGQLASKAAQDAKINPSQLSQSDLTGGLDTVGELVRAVEQVEDIIPVLPRFKSKPHDKPDFTIWSYINYARDLEGKSLVDYEDVYEFYEARKKEYEEEFGKIDGDDEQ